MDKVKGNDVKEVLETPMKSRRQGPSHVGQFYVGYPEALLQGGCGTWIRVSTHSWQLQATLAVMVVVRTNTRCSWEFTVTDVNGRSVLNQGWPQFAIAHKLKSRYFLIFKRVVHQSSQYSSSTTLAVRWSRSAHTSVHEERGGGGALKYHVLNFNEASMSLWTIYCCVCLSDVWCYIYMQLCSTTVVGVLSNFNNHI
jgi:hypothetical protein